MTKGRFLSHIPRVEARAMLGSLVVGVALLAVKFVAYFLTGSTVILSDALESIVNVLASSFAMYALSLAHRPADREHPYGHGKIEFFSAGFEGGMIVVAAGVIVVEAIASLIKGHGPQEHLTAALWLVGLVVVVNAATGWLLVRAGTKRNSLALEADGHHLLTDAVTSAGAIGALLIVHYTGFRAADPLGAIAVAAYILIIGLRLVRRSAAGLMDRQDLADEAMLGGLLDAHVGPGGMQPRICAYHKVKHRHSGRYHWVDFHIVVPRHWDIAKGHDVGSSIEHEIERALGEGKATVHIEPCIRPECPMCHSTGGT